MEELGDLKDLVLQYARGIWKNRWIAMAVAWMVLIVGVIGVDQMKNKYKAETKVYIDSSSVLRPLLRGIAIQSDFDAIVQLMVRQLLSRPNLERAVRILDMDLYVNGPLEMEELIEDIRKRVDISAKKRSGIYTITYIDTDRRKARQMVQTLLDIFVEDTLGKTVNQSDSAIEFLDVQIAKYDKLLRDTEQRREDFKRENIGLMPNNSKNYFTQLQEIERQIEQSELVLSEFKNRSSRIKAQIAEFKANQSSQGEVVVRTSLDDRIEEQERKLDEMLLLYTDQHPDVINVQHVLETLRERKEDEIKKIQPNRTLEDSPVYQDMQIQLSQTGANISTVSTRVESLKKKHLELAKLVDIVPKIEGELLRLDRDYEVHKKNYNELVGRREQARISDEVESGTEQVKFRVIEPPYVPLRPDFPNRALFDLAVLLIAIGIGYGFALLLSLLQPVIYNQKDLMRQIGGSILGAVSKFDTPNVLSKRRKNAFVFGLANLVFLCAGGVMIFLHYQGMLILSRIQTLVT
jgi:polysaccharide chain length determinant protein (PEP-CTERM system associated)